MRVVYAIYSMNFVTPAGVRAVDENTRQEIGFVLNGGMPAPPTRGARAPAKEEVKGLQEGPPLDYPRLNACFAKCPSIAYVEHLIHFSCRRVITNHDNCLITM